MMRRLLAGLALSAGWISPALADAPLHRYAVIVGANDGGDARVRLRYAHDDARAFAQVLTDLGGLAPDDRVLLYDPSPADLDDAFTALAARMGTADQRTEVLFYYSGHSNEDGLLLGSSSVDYPWIRSHLDALDADVRVAVLDSCASGALVRRKGGVRVPAFAIDASSAVEGYAYLTSSSADEAAQEADRIGGSYFTHFLTSGLRGAADVSGDGRVTLHEAYRFAFDETLARTERSQLGAQHPSYDFQLAGTGDLVLTDLTLGTASLLLDEGLDGRVTVRDAEGRLVAELLKPAGRAIELGLDAGLYRLTLSRDGHFAETTVSLADGARTDVLPEGLSWHIGEVATARGDALPAEAIARRVPLHASLLPTPPPANTTDLVALDLLGGRSDALDGFAFSLGTHTVDRDAHGLLVALGATGVGGALQGTELSMLYNSAESGRASQITLGANRVARDLRGAQLTLGANVVGGDLRGVQASMGINVAGGDVTGVQATVGVNVAVEDVTGLQAAAGLNLAKGIRGAQIGLLNIGHTIDGAQIGLVNVGHTVHGAQIGLVNVADDVQGASVGLLSFIRRGRLDLSLYGAGTTYVNADLKFGGRNVYTVIGGGTNGSDLHYVMTGLGVHIATNHAWLDIDVSGQSYLQTISRYDDENLFARVRLTAGVQITGALAGFVGADGTFDTGLGPHTAQWRTQLPGRGGIDTPGWVGIFAGIQVGKPMRRRTAPQARDELPNDQTP